ncbi:TonB-dependent receptor plug domain-containing protein [Methylovorus glucosotrophus]|uniref:TonB-dependent receptor n=1 Tax=Methylovorus glucosotrophus (strain SIP3-4) TaxID=582744 RepID=C6XCA1_METGS|nr:TonB-dependent receptor [Methylovorus glucosotrophus]ACT50176.1 TonB-dependent receptor [Methylovorus glucosotrophus SIP3-4]
MHILISSRSLMACLLGSLAVLPGPALAVGDITDIPLEQLVETDVQTAASISQQISQSSSAVSIVTAEDIKLFGYRTLADILASMRGLQVSNDRQYDYMGGRGFGRTGDYPGRVMLLIDGFQANDNLYNSAYLGQDGLLDTELIERVEYVSGPGSVTYGNGAFYGIINIITKTGQQFDGTQVSTEFSSYQGRKQRITYGKVLDNGADVLMSASTFYSAGQNLYFKEFASGGSDGVARDLDGERNRRYFIKGSYEQWSLEGGYVSRYKDDPTAAYSADFNAKPSSLGDASGFLNLKYDDTLSPVLKMSLRTYYGQYRNAGRYMYDGELFSERGIGRWWGTDIKFVDTRFSGHRLLMGAEYRQDYQQDFELPTGTLHRQTQTVSSYIQDEYSVSPRLTLNYGARLDLGNDHLHQVSPRAGLAYELSGMTTLKASYSTAFRRPNVYEKYYSDRSIQRENPDLKNELVKAYELVLEHRPLPNIRILSSLYHYQTQRRIGETYVNGNTLQYFNWPDSHARGADIELEQHWDNGAYMRASYAWQDNRDDSGKQMINSPRHMAKSSVSYPLLGPRLNSGLEVLYMGQRPDDSRATLPSYTLVNLTLVSRQVIPNLEVSASLKNLLDRDYAVAASSYMLPDRIAQNGRTFWLQCIYDFK